MGQARKKDTRAQRSTLEEEEEKKKRRERKRERIIYEISFLQKNFFLIY